LSVVICPDESVVVKSRHLIFEEALLLGGKLRKLVEIVIRVVVLRHAPTKGKVVKAGLIVVTDVLVEETSYVFFRGRMMK
jgi:hypothetical protein